MNRPDIDYKLLPESLRGGMKRYIEDGIEPGHFLRAVLDNDLMEAFKRADGENIARMSAIMSFIYNEAPIGCHGSKEKVEEWLSEREAERAPKSAEQVLERVGQGE